MKLNKVIFLIIFLNLFALLLVYQRTEIIKFSYKNKESQDRLQELADKRNQLFFDLEHSKSLANIDERLFLEDKNFQLPTEAQIMLIKASYPIASVNTSIKAHRKKANIFSKALFWLEREAIARSGQ